MSTLVGAVHDCVGLLAMHHTFNLFSRELRTSHSAAHSVSLRRHLQIFYSSGITVYLVSCGSIIDVMLVSVHGLLVTELNLDIFI